MATPAGCSLQSDGAADAAEPAKDPTVQSPRGVRGRGDSDASEASYVLRAPHDDFTANL